MLGLPPFVFFAYVIMIMNFLGVVSNWDPMQTDYLSSQNKYHKLEIRARSCEYTVENYRTSIVLKIELVLPSTYL